MREVSAENEELVINRAGVKWGAIKRAVLLPTCRAREL